MAKRRLKIILMLLVGLLVMLACQLDQYTPQSQDTASSEQDATEVPSPAPPSKTPRPAATVTRTPIPIRVYAIAKANLNVRAAPSANAQVIDKLSKGDSLQVVGRTQASDWWQVALTSKPNQTGWISATMVTLNQPGASIPVIVVNALGTPQAPTATASPKPGVPKGTTPAPSENKPAVTAIPSRTQVPGKPRPLGTPTYNFLEGTPVG